MQPINNVAITRCTRSGSFVDLSPVNHSIKADNGINSASISRVTSFGRKAGCDMQTFVPRAQSSENEQKSSWGNSKRGEHQNQFTSFFASARSFDKPSDKQQTSAPSCKKSSSEASSLYETSADGACMFRSFLAAATQNPDWLSAKRCSKEQVSEALQRTGLDAKIKLAIVQAAQLMLFDVRVALAGDGNAATIGFNADHQQMATFLQQMASIEFADELYAETIGSTNFSLWETHSVVNHIYNLLAGESILAFYSLKPFWLEIGEHLTNLISQCIIEQLGIPIDTRLPLHLKAEGLHYNLVAPQNFFKQTLSSPQPLISLETVDILNQLLPPRTKLRSLADTLPPFVSYTAQTDDDSDFFRLLLAGASQNKRWLLPKHYSSALVQEAILTAGWYGMIVENIDSTFGLISNEEISITNELIALGLDNDEHLLLKKIINSSKSGEFSLTFCEQCLMDGCFQFWDEKRLQSYFDSELKTIAVSQGKQERVIKQGLCNKLEKISQWLGRRLQNNFIEQLGIPTSGVDQIHLQLTNNRCVLNAPPAFLRRTRPPLPVNFLLKNYHYPEFLEFIYKIDELLAQPKDGFYKTLKHRWGAVDDSWAANDKLEQNDITKEIKTAKAKGEKISSCTAKKRIYERDLANIFSEDHAKSYAEFTKKIAGFDLDEEIRNEPKKSLVSKQQAIDALGSLTADTLNYGSGKFAEKYDLNLNPKTNPGHDGFLAWMDKASQWLADTFNQAMDCNSEELELETIGRELDDKSPEELQKLDLLLAQMAKKIAEKEGPLEEETDSILNNLQIKAEQKESVYDPFLSKAERKRLAKIIRKKNDPEGKRSEWMRQQFENNFNGLHQFADGLPLDVTDIDVAHRTKVTNSDLNENNLSKIDVEELFIPPHPHRRNPKTDKTSAFSRWPDEFKNVVFNEHAWQEKTQDLKRPLQNNPDREPPNTQFHQQNDFDGQRGGYETHSAYATKIAVESKETVKQTPLPLHQAHKEVTRDSDLSLNPSVSSSGIFLFGGAEARPVPNLIAREEIKQYNNEYETWVNQNRLHREKRRADETVDPLHYLTLDYNAANSKPNAPVVDLTDIKAALTEYTEGLKTLNNNDPAQRTELLNRFQELGYQIGTARHGDPAANTFLNDGADLYAIRMFDTEPKVRLGYAYFQQRVREAAQKGLTYYDTGLEDFYGYRMPHNYDNPALGMSTRINALIAKTLAAANMQEALDPFRYGMAMAEIAIYSQMSAQIDAKPVVDAMLDLQDLAQHDPKTKQTVLRLNRDLSAVPDPNGDPSKKYRFKAFMFSQSQAIMDGAPIAPTNLGFCDLMASSIAFELKTARTESTSTRTADGTNVHVLKRILARTEYLESYLASDPVLAYRFMQGATHINDGLQAARYYKMAAHSRRLKSFDDLPRLIARRTHEDPIIFHMGRVSSPGGGHAISIAPIVTLTSANKKVITYLVTDANTGVIPCASLDQAVAVLKICGNDFLGQDPTDTDVSDLKLIALPVNDQVVALMKDPIGAGITDFTIQRLDGDVENFRYGDMFGESDIHWSHWAKHNDASESASWSKLLPPELAKRTVEVGDYNIQADLKEKFGPDAGDVLIPKSNTIIDQLINIGTMRDVGCQQGVCTEDFFKYFDGEDPLIPPVPKREPKTTTGLLAQQFAFAEGQLDGDGPGEAIYGNVKRHAPLKRKGAIRRKKATPKISVDVMYEAAKPVLGLDLDDAIYGNIISSANEKGISLIDDDIAAFKQAAADMGLSDDDIMGPVGIKNRKQAKVAASDDDIWGVVGLKREKHQDGGGARGIRQRNHDASELSGVINQDELVDKLSQLKTASEQEIIELGKTTLHSSDNKDSDYVRAILGNTDPRLDPNTDLPWMTAAETDVHSDVTSQTAAKNRIISGDSSLASNKALTSAGNVLEAAALAEELTLGKPLQQSVGALDDRVSRHGAAETTVESVGDKIRVKRQGGVSVEIEIENPTQKPSKRSRFKAAADQLKQKVFEAEMSAVKIEETPLNPETSIKTQVAEPEIESLSKLAEKISSFDDPELLRQMYLSVDEIQVENQRLLAISAQVETDVANILREQGDSPSDWKLLPPKGGAEIQEFTFAYRGTHPELQGQTQTVKLSRNLAQRWRQLSSNVQEIANRISNSEFTTKVQGVVSSKAYQGAGKALGLVSKAMSLYSLYNLAFESQNMQGLRPYYRASFALGAIDTVLDTTSNMLSLGNKLFKTAHMGVANTALQNSARAVAKISSVVGIGASIGSVIAHSIALGEAKTPFEYDMAATNLAFTTTALALSAIAMAFPVAGPLIAAVSLLLFAIQMAVMEYKMEAEKIRLAKDQFEGFFDDTEKLLEILEAIASTSLDEVKIVGEGNEQRIVINLQASASKIEISSETIRLQHADNSYSIVYLTNVDPVAYSFPKPSNWQGQYIPYLVDCSTNKDSCTRKIPNFLKSYAEKSGMSFTGGKASYQAQFKDMNVKNYIKREVKTDTVMPCLLLNKNKDAASKQVNQTLFNEQYKSFLASNFTLPVADPSSNQTAASSILLTEIYPKVKLMSDMENYPLDQYQSHYHQASTKPRAMAVTNQCSALYTSNSVNNTCSTNTDADAHACSSTTEFNWAHRANFVTYPKTAPAANQRKMIEGPAALLATNKMSDGITHYWLGQIQPQTVASATPIGSVKLEPADPIINIDLKTGDSKTLIVTPERYSSQYLIGKMQTFTLASPNKKNQQTTLFLHEDTKKTITKPVAYNVSLTANQDQNLAVGMGSRMIIHEKDAKVPLSKTTSTSTTASSAPPTRSGAYYLTFFPSYTEQQKKDAIAQLEKTINEQRDGVEPSEPHNIWKARQDLEYARNRLATGSCANEAPLGFSDYVAPCEESLKRSIKQYEDRIAPYNQKIAILRESRRLLAIERELTPQENKQFKLTVTIKDSTTGSGKDISLTMGTSKTEQTLAKNNYKELYTSAVVEIKDCQRDIFISHKERVVVDSKEHSIACEFKVDKVTGNVSLETIAGLSTTLHGAKVMQQLYTQLKKNNPNITIPNNMMLGSFDLSNTDPVMLGVSPENQTDEAGANTQQDLSLNQRFLGHALVLDLNNSNTTVINVIAAKEQYLQHEKVLKNLQFLGAETVSDVTTVPDEFKPLFYKLSADERKVYFLYDPQTRVLVTQWLGAPLRINEQSDIKICPPNTKPNKFTQAGGSADRYDCSTADHVSLLSQISEAEQKGITVLQCISQKARSVLPAPLKLLNPGLRENNGQNKIPLLMQFNVGEPDSLVLMKKYPDKKAGIITVDSARGIALIGEEIAATNSEDEIQLRHLNAHRAALNLEPAVLLKLTAQPLLTGEELTSFLAAIADESKSSSLVNGLPATVVNSILEQGVCLNQNMPITAVRRNADDGDLFFETLDGVAFSASADLSNKHLVSVTNSYWRGIGVDPDNRTAIIREYQDLTEFFGKPTGVFLKLSDGEHEYELPAAENITTTVTPQTQTTNSPTFRTTKLTTRIPTTATTITTTEDEIDQIALNGTSTAVMITTTAPNNGTLFNQTISAGCFINTNSTQSNGTQFNNTTALNSTDCVDAFNLNATETFNRTQAEIYLRNTGKSDLEHFFQVLNSTSKLDEYLQHFNVSTQEELFTNLNITPTDKPLIRPTEQIELTTLVFDDTVSTSPPVTRRHRHKTNLRIKKDEKDEKIVFINSLTEKLLYVPRTNQTSSRTALLGTLENRRETIELTALDPEHQTLVSVYHPTDPLKVYQAKSVEYQYFNIQGGSVFLALSPDQEQQELPYLPATQLVLLPQQRPSKKEESLDEKLPASSTPATASVTALSIDKVMQQQLKIVTIVPAKSDDSSNGSEITAKLVVEGDQRAVRAFTAKDENNKKIFYLALPTKLLGKDKKAALSYLSGTLIDLTTTHLFVRLIDVLDDNGAIKNGTSFDIEFNGKNIATEEELKKLLTNAKELKL